MNIRQIDDKLYMAAFSPNAVGDYVEIWDSIKNNDEVLTEAIKVEKDKFGERDLVKGLSICHFMLIDYKTVNKEIYQNLVNLIYSNTEIARIVIDGYSNGGYSYLLMTLWNHDLVLTEEQKQFAVSEAMNKIGTKRWAENQKKFELELANRGITNDKTTYINLGGSINPIGEKAATEYVNSMFSSLSDSQAHGTKPFDIRYQILFNPNWTNEEKQKLIYDFYTDSEAYDEYLGEWEWGIINENVNDKGKSMPELDMDLLYDYTYDNLLKLYNHDKETTDLIWNQINFCRLMHELRPQQWELEFESPKVKKQV